MKLWKFEHPDNLEYAVIFANTPREALDKLVKSRKEFEIDGNLENWNYEEFTPDIYEGCLF